MNYFAEHSIRTLLEFKTLIARHPDLSFIDDYQTFRKESMHREKNCVIFAKKRGGWLKPFHCYQQHFEYSFFSLDLAEGCKFDCVYCYLQSYLNHGALVLFVNFDDLRNELQSITSRMWLSTGLLTDSLLAEKEYSLMPQISKLIPHGSILELRTKSDDLSPLKSPQICAEPIVISWSLNPPSIATTYEYGAASTESRFAAAREAIKLGFRVGFHFDPVFHFDGWMKAYQNLFSEMEQFSKNSVAFLSIGLFRYMPDLGAVIRQRFPYHEILAGEFFPDVDGKYHYLRGIRKEMYTQFQKWIAPWKAAVPVFWSMEPDDRLLQSSFAGV